VERALGAALLIGAAAMTLRYVLDRRGGRLRTAWSTRSLSVRSLRSRSGCSGGSSSGMTSVGSGSLIIVLLLFVYPLLGANQLVGTDLAQAVPLTGAAALGALAFGHVEFSVTTSIIVGKRSGGARRIVSLFEGARPVRASHHHVRHLRFGPQVHRGEHTALGWICA